MCSADEDQRRDVVRAAGPPQRAAEERGAGMPRRRRNLASVMANRRPQREAVERGKAPEINMFSVLEESAQLVLELSYVS